MPLFEQPKSRGEILFPEVEWSALLGEFKELRTHEEKMEFFATKLPGLAAVGCVTDGANKIQRNKDAQQYIDSILADPGNIDKTGFELNLNGTPGVLCSSPAVTLMANSNVLTPRHLKEVENIKANGGAEFAMLYMDQPTKDQGYAGLHFEPVIIPKDSKDGKALTFSVALAYDKTANPLARRYIMDRYGVEDLGIPPLTSCYGRMLGSPNGTISNGPNNIMLAVREQDWALSVVETLGHEKAKHQKPIPGQDYGRVAFPATIVALWPDLSREDLSKVLQIEALYQLSLTVIGIAPEHLLAKKDKKPRIYDILPENRHMVYDKVSRKVAEEHVRRVVRDKEMFKIIISGFSSWGNYYTAFADQHPDLEARELIFQAHITLVNELKELAG
ncbi:hypothetical protein MN608_10760 [Microdochium nivale]|nr:hypothetical protein MN608_10760 [Microdochium nivale]